MSVIQQNHVFIDPEHCNSSVGYHITMGTYENRDKVKSHTLSATVVLADCSHKIDWVFDSDYDNNEKITAAIDMLVEFRKKYNAARKMITQLNK
jgi:hypothetical protein